MTGIRLKAVSFALLILPPQLFAGESISMYLYSRVSCSGTARISDICRLDGPGDWTAEIAALELPEKLYEDGLVDSSEIVSLLKDSGFDRHVDIYGSSVRFESTTPHNRAGDKDPQIVLVDRDHTVRIVYRRNGISVELKGKALNSGKAGDEIEVRSGKRIIRAVVTGNDVVEILM